jgi:hypothetical protein
MPDAPSCRADGADMHTGGLRPSEERDCARRRPRRTIVVVEAMPAAGSPEMLAQQLSGVRRQQPDVQIIPLHLHPPPDPAGRRAVVRGLDFDAAIQVHRPFAVPVIAKRFEREWAEGRLLFGNHRRDLPLRRAVDPRIGPARLPPIQVCLRRLETLEAESSQRCLLCVPDARFDFAFSIGITDATGQRDDAVVREHVAIERIERRIVDVGREHALFQIVEDDDADGPAESTKRAFV